MNDQDVTMSLHMRDEVTQRATNLYEIQENLLHRRIDRVFSLLMPTQWLFGIGCALLLAPKTWNGPYSSIHLHVWAAIFLGGLISSVPTYLAITKPGLRSTRHVIAAGQMLTSALLIHLTNGRLETHFHIFGSLALLTFYREWRVLRTATIVVIADHFIRGTYFPQSVYGIVSESPWRWLEHAGWVAFEDVFLFYSCLIGKQEMQTLCTRQSELEFVNAEMELRVRQRTSELNEIHDQLDLERIKTVESSRLASLGEMAGGIAHEINNPLAIIMLRASQARRILSRAEFSSSDKETSIKFMETIESVTQRISNIILGLKTFSRNADNDPFSRVSANQIVNDALILIGEKIKNSGIDLRLKSPNEAMQIECRPSQIVQVLTNLLSNASHAISSSKDKWIEVELLDRPTGIMLSVTDSGTGIPDHIRAKLFQPFFTTKELGQGTGLGLSISRGLIEAHGGTLQLDSDNVHTKFVIELNHRQQNVA